jgi:hypothetical protein
MISFKDFLLTNPGMEKDAHLAYMRAKRRKSQDYGNNAEGVKEKIIKRWKYAEYSKK